MSTVAKKIGQNSLVADQLRDDPRIVEAKRMILDAVQEHRSQIDALRPPIESLKQSYQQSLEEFGRMRGGGLYFPYLGSGIGNGAWVELADGSVKLDMITGIGVHGFGHSDPLVIEASLDAAISDTVMQGNLQQNADSVSMVSLLLLLANQFGAGLDHCFLTTSGAMANENALKIALQKRCPASRVMALEHCFAGRTLALAQVSDKPNYRDGLPKVLDVDFLPFFDPASGEASTRRALNELRSHLHRYPGQHACLWLELVQGEGGYNVGDRDYFLALIREAKRHELVVVVDEIQTFGRTSQPLAYQHFQLDQQVDIVTVGKITQVCATLFRESVRPRPGLISQTFTGNTQSIRAGEAILRGLVDGGHFGLDGKNVALHQQCMRRLQAIGGKHPGCVSGPFGIGGMFAFTPFDGSLKKAKEMVSRLYQAGVISFIAGSNPTRVRFLMPLGSITEAQIDLACDLVDSVIEEMKS